MLPTLYDHYTGNGITTGLSPNQLDHFTLNTKNITLYSGALNYFRVPQEYWRDRLRKMRAAGLNTVETYVPWNLHEPEPGVFDFGDGGSDFQHLLNIKKFLKVTQEEDLLAIIRPGPFICAEWEFGGMPSWLLKHKGIRVRTSDEIFVYYVKRFLKTLLSVVTMFQFSKGGPIVAFQIENEYGSVGPYDFRYLEVLKETYEGNGVTELLFTSDMPSMGKSGMIPGVLYTANFQDNAQSELRILQSYQPGKASMVMEYWTGWFDHWTERHRTRSLRRFRSVLEDIVSFPASVNMYMFHGGTNWGFLNGANIDDDNTDNGGFNPITTSYDYDAPLTEAGDYTDKYYAVKELIEKYNKFPTKIPEVPLPTPRVHYPDIQITKQLNFNEIIDQSEHHIQSFITIPMEDISINNDAGQSYGYIVYRKTNLEIPGNSQLQIEGRVCDTAMVLINGRLRTKILNSSSDLHSFGYWKAKDATLDLGEEHLLNATLEIVVENWGRNNFGQLHQFNQNKGLWHGNVLLNNIPLVDWQIVPLEFKSKWTNNLSGWHNPDFNEVGPALYKGVLHVENRNDTYIDMRGWKKGIVIVNGFVLARYLRIGPQQAAFLPAPFLKDGDNEIIVFEHFVPDIAIKFISNQVFETLL